SQGISLSPAEPTSKTTPTVLVKETDAFGYTIGAGVLYWWANCVSIKEFHMDGFLKEMPAQGGAEKMSIIPSADCNTIDYAAADDSGLYFFNSYKSRIELRTPSLPSSSAPNPPTILYTIGQNSAAAPTSNLMLDGSFIYWTSQNAIIRAA